MGEEAGVRRWGRGVKEGEKREREIERETKREGEREREGGEGRERGREGEKGREGPVCPGVSS